MKFLNTPVRTGRPPTFEESKQESAQMMEWYKIHKGVKNEMVTKAIQGDPSGFAGVSEHSHQVALFAALAQYRVWAENMGNEQGMDGDPGMAEEFYRLAEAIKWIHAVPNGGTRGGDKRSAMIAGANMKAEGVKTGVSDIDVPFPAHGYHGFKIEMKAPGKGPRPGKPDGDQTYEQVEYGAYLRQCGYLYAVFDNWADALKAIKWYLSIEQHPFEWAL